MCVGVHFIVVLICISLRTWMSLSVCLLSIFLKEVFCSNLYPLLIELFSYCWVLKFLIYSGYKSFTRHVICIYSSWFCGLSFHFVKSFFKENFNSDEVQCINVFIFMAHPSGVISNKSYILHLNILHLVWDTIWSLFFVQICLVFRTAF